MCVHRVYSSIVNLSRTSSPPVHPVNVRVLRRSTRMSNYCYLYLPSFPRLDLSFLVRLSETWFLVNRLLASVSGGIGGNFYLVVRVPRWGLYASLGSRSLRNLQCELSVTGKLNVGRWGDFCVRKMYDLSFRSKRGVGVPSFGAVLLDLRDGFYFGQWRLFLLIVSLSRAEREVWSDVMLLVHFAKVLVSVRHCTGQTGKERNSKKDRCYLVTQCRDSRCVIVVSRVFKYLNWASLSIDASASQLMTEISLS